MKVYELIVIQEGVERSLGCIFKDEKRAFMEKAVQNCRCGAENNEYAPYQVRERKVL